MSLSSRLCRGMPVYVTAWLDLGSVGIHFVLALTQSCRFLSSTVCGHGNVQGIEVQLFYPEDGDWWFGPCSTLMFFFLQVSGQIKDG